MSLGLWLRWTWRDLRARWLQVAAIALIIALGTGTYSGLASTSDWRRRSAEASYDLTLVHDLHIELPAASSVPAGTLEAALGGFEAAPIEAVEERLVVPTHVDASTADETLLVPGRIVGSRPDATVDRAHVTSGEGFTGTEEAVLLEHRFAEHHELGAAGTLQVAGGTSLPWVGTAMSPEYFVVITERGGVYAHTGYAVLFTSLETAQAIAGAPGAVNDAVVRFGIDLDRGAVAAELAGHLAVALPDVGVTVETLEEDPAYRSVWEDIHGDQEIFNIFAVAIFLGAVFAAFNLTTRMVEAQRREIGIAMALGVPSRTLALRPMLAGAQIALLGVLFGVGVGVGIAQLMRTMLIRFLPLPIWETPFQPGVFAVVAVVGLIIPVLAISYPVWRAVRVSPVDAIASAHLVARGNRIARVLQRIPLRGNSFAQLPFRNLVRSPRRAVLTLLGLAAVVTVVIGVVGMIDSFVKTIDEGEAEVLGDRPDLMIVNLDRPYPSASPAVAAVTGSPALAMTDTGFVTGGALRSDDIEFDSFLIFRDLDSELWRPRLMEGSVDRSGAGLYLARKAANDLDVGVGDTVVVRHPRVEAGGSYVFTESELVVLGVHPHPYRFNTYLHAEETSLLGLPGIVNTVYGDPAPGVSAEGVARALFDLPSVASVERAAATAEVARDLIGQILGILQIVQGVVLLLALLIAFNASSLNMDERARDHATSFAFGVRARTVMRMAVVESFTIGVLATLVGLGGGYLMLRWLVGSIAPRVTPDLFVPMILTPLSLVLVVGVGIVAVGIAPVFNLRRLRRMDIPSTLRVVE